MLGLTITSKYIQRHLKKFSNLTTTARRPLLTLEIQDSSPHDYGKADNSPVSSQNKTARHNESTFNHTKGSFLKVSSKSRQPMDAK
jgi:hypothetical protein